MHTLNLYLIHSTIHQRRENSKYLPYKMKRSDIMLAQILFEMSRVNGTILSTAATTVLPNTNKVNSSEISSHTNSNTTEDADLKNARMFNNGSIILNVTSSTSAVDVILQNTNKLNNSSNAVGLVEEEPSIKHGALWWIIGLAAFVYSVFILYWLLVGVEMLNKSRCAVVTQIVTSSHIRLTIEKCSSVFSIKIYQIASRVMLAKSEMY